MPRKIIPLEIKLEQAKERQRKRAARVELRKEAARLKFQAKVAKLRAKQAEEQAFLKAEVDRLTEMAGGKSWQFAYPTPAQRTVVTNFRAWNGWSIRKMARVCACESRHIRMIESNMDSIYMLKSTFGRILQAAHWTTGEPVVAVGDPPVDGLDLDLRAESLPLDPRINADLDPVTTRLRAEMANMAVHSHPVNAECGPDCSVNTGASVPLPPRPPVTPKRESGPGQRDITDAIVKASQNAIYHDHVWELPCTEACGAFGKTPPPAAAPVVTDSDRSSRSRSRSGNRDDVTAALREENRKMITHNHPQVIACAAGCPGWVAPPVIEAAPPAAEVETAESEPESEWLTF